MLRVPDKPGSFQRGSRRVGWPSAEGGRLRRVYLKKREGCLLVPHGPVDLGLRAISLYGPVRGTLVVAVLSRRPSEQLPIPGL